MTAPVQEGEILAGKYRVERVLGVGGMGVVVAAHHIQLDEHVALKFLLPEVLSVPEAVARFTREARAAAKIKSEHVARVTDVGQLENGAPYMVMEYLDGGDLSAWLEQCGALPVEQAVEFVLQACEAIAEAHSLGIVHRDLKPANLFCIRRPDGEMSIKVLDFGISKALSGSSSAPDMGMTKTQAVMGSPLYMSPEQMRSARDVDARTDIWALGVILFELVTGQLPFGGETLPELVLNVATQAATPVRDLKPELPVGLAQVIERCLQKQREARYANVAELATALVEFGPQRSHRSVERISQVLHAAGVPGSTVALPSSGQSAATNPGTVASWGRTSPARGRKTALVALVGMGVVVAIALLGVGAFFLHSVRHAAAATSAGVGANASASSATEAPPTTSASAAVLPAPSASAAPIASTSPVASAAPVTSASPRAAAAPTPTRKPRAHRATAHTPRTKRAPQAPRHPAAAPKYNPLDHL